MDIKGTIHLYDGKDIKGRVGFIMVEEADIDDDMRIKLGRGTPMAVDNSRLKYKYGKTDIFSY